MLVLNLACLEATRSAHIEFRACEVAETKDLDENTLLDLDNDGQICAITIEHASERAEIPKFSYEQITP